MEPEYIAPSSQIWTLYSLLSQFNPDDT